MIRLENKTFFMWLTYAIFLDTLTVYSSNQILFKKATFLVKVLYNLNIWFLCR